MTDIKGKYWSLTFLNLPAYSWLVAKMPEILTYNTPPNIEKGKTKQSIFKSFFDSFNSKDKFTKLFLITFALIIIATPFIVWNKQIFTPKAATTLAPNTVDQVIATRGDNLLPHEINLPSPMDSWSWGQHGTESTKSKQPSSGSVAPWLVMFRDATTINTATSARFNVRRLVLYNYQPSNSTWVKLFDGLPQWRVSSNPDTTSGYTDITPTIESDGSYSFAISAGRVLHMAAGPWPSITEGNGVLAIVEARLLGNASDITAAKAAVAPGSDYRASGGDFSQGMSTPGYYEAGFGHFGLLTGDWKAFDMLSSTLTDSQFQANHPAELGTATVASPTPTPPQATTQPVLPPPLNSFRAEYFNNQTLTGTPAYSTNTTSINYNWGTGSPATGVSADHFSARYTGSFNFDGSTYKFNATSDDGVRVYVDSQLIIDAWKDQAPTTYSASKTPTSGNHTVTVEYYENAFGATLSVNWAKTSPILPCTFTSSSGSARKYGDVNNNTYINPGDATLVRRSIAGIDPPLAGDNKKAADVNGDGVITTADSDLILQFYFKVITTFPVCP